jgi:hypothetical protein
MRAERLAHRHEIHHGVDDRDPLLDVQRNSRQIGTFEISRR